jgi:pyrrolysine biosynthesis protein PylC
VDGEKKKMVENKLRILVAGGKLQGTEIVYLSQKAGYCVTLIDRCADVPTAGIADIFIAVDIFDEHKMIDVIRNVDYVIPAIEDIAVLDKLGEYCEKTGVRYIFDREAYSVSCSKSKTNRLLKSLGIDIPGEFPGCGYPLICKPDTSSGSRGIIKIETKEEFDSLIQSCKNGYVAQQYLTGPSYSLEVLGNGYEAVFPMITEVVTDEEYDCKRIVAPAGLCAEQEKEFIRIAEKINSSLKINGIFDIEVVLNNGCLYVLEIDARFPSQTPISIYHASGMNFVEILIALADRRRISEFMKQFEPDNKRTCVYQQILVENNTLKVCGEHIMSDAGRLQIIPGFCKADEMITDYSPDSNKWRAIVILTCANMEEAEAKWEECIREIAVIQGCEKMIYIEG